MNLEFRSFVAVLFGLVLSTSSSFAEESPATAEAETPSVPSVQSEAPATVPAVTPQPPPPSTVSEPSLVPPSASPLRIDGPNGTSIRIGLLLQPQLQAVNSPTLSGYSKNMYLRRTRILLGGTLLDKIEYFVDTDYPNLFLDSNTGTAAAPDYLKNTTGMNVQDAFVTFKAMGNMLKVDVGYMLPAMAHNALQGAGTLYGFDYYSYSFAHTIPGVFGTAGSSVGRDVGVQLRGLLVDGHIEYRLGIFQGLRENRTDTQMEARNFFRVTGRVQINLLDPEPGFFYAGTYLGAKKVASIGGSYDFQDKYKYFAADGIVDLPVGPGVATAQVNLAHWDGGTFIPAMVKQTALMGEAGYTVAEVRLSPIVRVERRWGSGAVQDETRMGGGIAFWPYGHTSNVKAFYARVKTNGEAKGYNQLNLQWQVYFF
jgi:hypothetical protein